MPRVRHLFIQVHGLILPLTRSASGQPQICSTPQSARQAARMAKTNFTRADEGGCRAHFAIRINQVRVILDR